MFGISTSVSSALNVPPPVRTRLHARTANTGRIFVVAVKLLTRPPSIGRFRAGERIGRPRSCRRLDRPAFRDGSTIPGRAGEALCQIGTRQGGRALRRLADRRAAAGAARLPSIPRTAPGTPPRNRPSSQKPYWWPCRLRWPWPDPQAGASAGPDASAVTGDSVQGPFRDGPGSRRAASVPMHPLLRSFRDIERPVMVRLQQLFEPPDHRRMLASARARSGPVPAGQTGDHRVHQGIIESLRHLGTRRSSGAVLASCVAASCRLNRRDMNAGAGPTTCVSLGVARSSSAKARPAAGEIGRRQRHGCPTGGRGCSTVKCRRRMR